jgi:hypothetical protein
MPKLSDLWNLHRRISWLTTIRHVAMISSISMKPAEATTLVSSSMLKSRMRDLLENVMRVYKQWKYDTKLSGYPKLISSLGDLDRSLRISGKISHSFTRI